MQGNKPIVAIVGSARAEIVGNLEEAARIACWELGRALAEAGCRILVYSSDSDYIEADVVRGFIDFVSTQTESIADEKLIKCYFPQGAIVQFPGMEHHEIYFEAEIDPGDNIELSFYRSITQVDGVILLGGRSSTLAAGHVALSKELPIIAIAHFGGAAQKIWRHLSATPPPIQSDDVQVMAQWKYKSAQDCVASLMKQYERTKTTLTEKDKIERSIKEKANKWDLRQQEEADRFVQGITAAIFLIIFLILLIIGITTSSSGPIYTTITILGLCAAGGLGSTVRMVVPGAPSSKLWQAPLLGIVVGIVFSLLYLIPQLIGESSFLSPNAMPSGATRVQYITASLVAFMTGLGFDYALEQLIRKAKEKSEDILRSPN